MQLQRFFGEFDLSRAAQRVNDQGILHQLLEVLRLRPGDLIMLADGKGNEAVAKILKLTKDFADLAIQKTVKNSAEPKRAITLYSALLKKENFEWVVQKATEVGVKRIVPLITKRTVKLGLSTLRLEKIAKEAAEQSGRGMVPLIHRTLTFTEALPDAAVNDVNLFFDVDGTPFVETKAMAKAKRIGVFIGPEGGWDHEEFIGARAGEFEVVSLGKLVLRAETAAVVGSYLAARD
jgi:16S rRNA (uracil1498-N3)-methyltransferase